MVELGDDHQSLAETSLGEYTAGGRGNSRKAFSQKPIQPLGSFDENSLYTTPFSVQHEEENYYYRSTILPLASPSLVSNKYSKTNELDDSDVFSQSVDNTTQNNVKEHSKWRNKPSPAVPSSARRSIPVDVDSAAPYYDDDLRITKIEPLELGLSTVKENDDFSNHDSPLEDDDFTRDASELDVW
jgi:hypothetical protein